MHPPAMAPNVWLTVTDYLGWLYTPAGEVADTARVQPMVTGGTLGASAASLTQGFVPNFKGLEVWSHTLHDLAHPLQDEDFSTSNPAVTRAGRVYVVSQTGDKSVLFAFGPP